MPETDEINEMPCGLPPCVVLGGGSILAVTFICALIGMNPSAQRWIANIDKAQRSQCGDDISVPLLHADLDAFKSSVQSIQTMSQVKADDRVHALLKSINAARKIMRCKEGATRLGNISSLPLAQMKHELTRMYCAKRKTPTCHRVRRQGNHSKPLLVANFIRDKKTGKLRKVYS